MYYKIGRVNSLGEVSSAAADALLDGSIRLFWSGLDENGKSRVAKITDVWWSGPELLLVTDTGQKFTATFEEVTQECESELQRRWEP